jgi:hypothetical protein
MAEVTPLFPPRSPSLHLTSPPLTAASLHSARSLHIYPCLRPVPTLGPSLPTLTKLASHFGNFRSAELHADLLRSFVGYSSGAAGTILAGLGEPERDVEGAETGGGDPFEGVHFRTLGDVGYLMTSFNTPAETVRALERRVLDCCPSGRRST